MLGDPGLALLGLGLLIVPTRVVVRELEVLLLVGALPSAIALFLFLRGLRLLWLGLGPGLGALSHLRAVLRGLFPLDLPLHTALLLNLPLRGALPLPILLDLNLLLLLLLLLRRLCLLGVGGQVIEHLQVEVLLVVREV